MAPEGMVDALDRIHGLLDPDGRLVDLHPTVERAHLELESSDGTTLHPGDLISEDARDRHERADRAVARVIADGLFTMEAVVEVSFRRYADSIDELRGYVAARSTGARFDDRTVKAVHDTHRPGAALWLREQLRVTKLRPVSTARLRKTGALTH
jgi:hypothetical protein